MRSFAPVVLKPQAEDAPSGTLPVAAVQDELREFIPSLYGSDVLPMKGDVVGLLSHGALFSPGLELTARRRSSSGGLSSNW